MCDSWKPTDKSFVKYGLGDAARIFRWTRTLILFLPSTSFRVTSAVSSSCEHNLKFISLCYVKLADLTRELVYQFFLM